MNKDLLRVRSIIRSYCELPEKFSFYDHEVVSKKISTDSSGRNTHIIDYFMPSASYKNAYFSGIEVHQELIDKLSYLSYSSVHGFTISVCQKDAQFDSPFRIGLNYRVFNRSTHMITEADLNDLSAHRPDSTVGRALRSYQQGLTSSNPFEATKNLWTSMEVLAQEEAKKNNSYINKECKKCSHVYDKHPAQQNVIRDYYSISNKGDNAEESKKKADAMRRNRGSLVHGAKVNNSEQRLESIKWVTELQSVATVAINKATNKIPIGHTAVYSDMDYLELKIKVTQNNEIILEPDHSIQFHMVFSMLPEWLKSNDNFSFGQGIHYPILIDPIALPDLIASPK